MNATHRRLLLIDDNRAIHDDIRKILLADHASTPTLDALESELFGAPPEAHSQPADFEIDSAHQGKDGLALVERALAEGRPYSLAFVDVRMPPGWDGIETIGRLWKVNPELHVVLCTAYSDHSWKDIVHQLGQCDRLLVLKKPFDPIEVSQMANALCEKWELHRRDQLRLSDLEQRVRERTTELEEANHRLRGEMAQRERLEVELRLSQKLEAVGQLAAGVAHEINTPVQFVGDSIDFLRDALESWRSLLAGYRAILASLPATEREHAEDSARQAEQAIDFAYLEEHVPLALRSAVEGTTRVADIVRAMKEFAHPDHRETSADLNRAVLNTMVIARNEYKFVADVVTDLGDIPPVLCHLGDLNQVFLNLIVNACHAIKDAKRESMGTIGVRTFRDGDHVVVAISDTGCGIPESIRSRVFDLFFTTKEVGRGTGQGLAIARSITVDGHRGTLTFESKVGRGTTFYVRIPIDEVAGARAGTGARRSAVES